MGNPGGSPLTLDDAFIVDLTVALFHSSPDAIFVVDDHGVIRMLNKQAEWLTGHHQAVMLGQPIEMLLPGGLRERHQAHRDGYMADLRIRPMETSPLLDIRMLHKDGTELPVDINLSPLVTGLGTFVIATARRRNGRGMECSGELRGDPGRCPASCSLFT